jgi:hypothetical protein
MPILASANPCQVDIILLEEVPLFLKKKIYSQGVIIYERGKDQCLSEFNTP